VVAMVRLVIGLLIVGGRRVEHVKYVADDPVVRRFCGLQAVPGARTLGRWLRVFTMATVGRLQALNLAVIAPVLETLGLRTLTIDVDGVVVSTGLRVERAFRGFNPHHRKVASYYPIMAHLAETTHVLRVKNRSGNVHDGKAGLPFLRDLWATSAPSCRAAGGCDFAPFFGRMCCGGCRRRTRGMPSRCRSIGGWISSPTSGSRRPGWRSPRM
jgi:DDE family transposase